MLKKFSFLAISILTLFLVTSVNAMHRSDLMSNNLPNITTNMIVSGKDRHSPITRPNSSSRATLTKTTSVFSNHAEQIIGSYARGHIYNAVTLPEHGKGYEVIRLERHRNYGHHNLINFIERLGDHVRNEHLGVILIGDMSQHGGGRMPSGHHSHQIGLDADILFWQDKRSYDHPLSVTEKSNLHPISVIPLKRWQEKYGEIVKLAATDPDVARIFVNQAIKNRLCTAYPNETWLRKIRPWRGHTGHFHVRLNCPADSEQCVSQAPPPPGTGCVL